MGLKLIKATKGNNDCLSLKADYVSFYNSIYETSFSNYAVFENFYDCRYEVK